MTGTLVQCCWLLSDLCAGHCQWLHPDVLALWSGLVQDSPVHHLRHGLRLHLHPRTHGGRQVGQGSIVPRESINIKYLWLTLRYLAVVHPVSSLPTRTVRNVRWLIGLTWLLTLTSNIPILLTHNLLSLEDDGGGAGQSLLIRNILMLAGFLVNGDLYWSRV